MMGSDDKISLVLSDYNNLQSKLSQLSNTISSISNDEIIKAEGLRQLAAVRASFNGIGSYLSSTIATTHYNKRRSPDSTAAQTVFAIPELRELILQHAELFDILAARQTCRELNNMIEASSKLQTQLFLRTVEQATHKSAAVKIHPMGHFKSQYERWFEMKTGLWPVQYVSVQFCARDEGAGLLHVGALWRRTQICQPAITSLRVWSECMSCEWIRSEGEDLPEASLSTGKELTFGDLYDKASGMLGPGKVCNWCKTHEAFTVRFEAHNVLRTC